MICLGLNGGFRQHTRRLLEGCRGQEAIRVERCLGDSQQHCLGRCRLTAFGQHVSIGVSIDKTINQIIRQHLGITGLVHLHTAQHLPDDDLDVLITDIHTGVTIDALYLFDQVHLYRITPLDTQHILWVALTGSNWRSRRNLLAIRHHNVTCGRNGIRTLIALLKANREHALRIDEHFTLCTGPYRYRLIPILSRHQGNDLIFQYLIFIIDQHLAARRQWILIKEDVGGDDAHRTSAAVLVFDDLYNAIDLANLRLVFRHTRLKQFLHTRQTLCDVTLCSRNTTRMEGTHGQLCTRLTDRLCRYDTNGGAQFDQCICRQITSIALAANATMCQAGQHRAYTYRLDSGINNLIDHLIAQFISGLDILETRNGLCQYPPNQAAANIRQHHFLAVRFRDENTVGRSTVFLSHNDILCDVDQTPRQVARFSGTQGGISKTLTSAMATDKVLPYAQTFAEVTTNLYIDDTS